MRPPTSPSIDAARGTSAVLYLITYYSLLLQGYSTGNRLKGEVEENMLTGNITS
jgi:hypothetical protein